MASQTPALSRLSALVRAERPDLWVLSAYTLVVALLALVLPLATQAVVNSVAAGILLQPIVVLGLLVFAGLSLAGLLGLLQLGLVEVVQQRVFARTVLDAADRVARVRASAFRDAYAPDLANRFFDVLTVQKSLSKLLLDGLGAFAQALVSLLILGAFNPRLLLLAGGLVALYVVGGLLLGIGGLRTSVRESEEKYRVAEWLESVARNHVALKLHADPAYLARRTDDAVMAYLDARDGHFGVCRRQIAAFFCLSALASAGLLAAGGWLVLEGDLTLGGLVAAQMLLTLMLASLDKLARQNEKLFDLLTGLEKLGGLTDLPTEREGGRALPDAPGGASVACRGVRFGYEPGRPVLRGLDLFVAPGARASLVGGNGSGKSTLVALLCALEAPDEGTVEIDGLATSGADLAALRRRVGLVSDERNLVAGTVWDNIVLGRPHVAPDDVRWATELVGLAGEARLLANGLETRVVAGGGNLSRGVLQRVLIARAIVDRPRLLILDEGLAGIEEREAVAILERIYAKENPWTALDVSHEPHIVARAERVYVLADGAIVAEGGLAEVAQEPGSEFCRLFPYLSQSLRAGAPKGRRKEAVR